MRHWITKDKFSIKEKYMEEFEGQNKVTWRNLVWNRMSIPMVRFISCLVAKHSLKTKEYLRRRGIVDSDLCPLYGSQPETTSHLFFNCPFSMQCVPEIKN